MSAALLTLLCGRGSWTPRSLPGVALWLDAAALDGTADGASVDSWADWSGAGVVSAATQSSPAARPTYKTQVTGGGAISPSGRPGVFFAVDDCLRVDALAARLTGTDTPFTVGALFRPAATGSFGAALGVGRSQSASDLYAFTGFTDLGRAFQLRVCGTSKQCAGPDVGIGSAHALVWVQGETPGYLGRNTLEGSEPGVTADLDVTAASFNTCCVGMLDRGGTLFYPLNGYLQSLVVCQGALGLLDRARLAAWLRARGGI
ncbi:MAG: hypothetical protein NT029_10400 [Armatimonadetes bacterium]|nr:hypothetical protein [Armatimonadota bacterium]